MLKQRVITAIVLLAILLPALFYTDPRPFCAVALLLIAASAWEWGRLNGYGQGVSVGLGLACVAACALSWYGGLLDNPCPCSGPLPGPSGCWPAAGCCVMA